MPLGLGRNAHACTHTTFSPNIIHGGVKTNVIPDRVEIDVDIRALPGITTEEVDAMVNKAVAAGGSLALDPQDHGFMYGWSFFDLDGHHWEVFWMDPSAIGG